MANQYFSPVKEKEAGILKLKGIEKTVAEKTDGPRN